MSVALPGFLNRQAPLLLAFGVAAWVEALFKIEWSTACCLKPEDGPMPDAFGMPLPDERFSGVSSMEYDFVPLVYALNLLLLSLALYPVLRHAVRRLDGPGAAEIPDAGGRPRSRRNDRYAGRGRSGG